MVKANPQTTTKLKAIRELMENGATTGERQAAQAALSRLLERHGWTMADFEQVTQADPIKQYRFNFSNRFERLLLIQLAGIATENKTVRWSEGKRNKRGELGLMIYLKSSQYEQVRCAYAVHRKGLNAQLESMLKAYIQAQDLYIKTAEGKHSKELSPEELEELYRMLQLSKFIPRQTDGEETHLPELMPNNQGGRLQ
jgi:hypothetical protein